MNSHNPQDVFASQPPLIELQGITPARLLARCEGHNEYGSIKSTMVRYLLRQAFESGQLSKGKRVIEASSGNTGIALAGVGAELGLKVAIVLLEGADQEIVNRLESLGAELHFCNRGEGMRGMLSFIKNRFPDDFTIDQFRNKSIVDAYVECHRDSLLQQIEAINFAPDYMFSCIGTGGTFQGIGNILRERWPSIRLIAVEKEAEAAPIDGIRNTGVAYFGDNDIYDKCFADETVYVDCCPPIPEGLIASPSCGALLEAIRRYPLEKNSNALAIFCDARVAHTTENLSLLAENY